MSHFFNTTARNFPLDMDYSSPVCPPHKDLSDILAEHRYRRSRERLGPQKLFYKWHLQKFIYAVILNEKWFWPSRGHWWYLETIFFIVPTGKWGATGISWMETGVLLNIHPTVHKAMFHNKELSGQNVNNGEVETPCFKIICKQGTSLVIQRLTLDLPMQGVWAWSLVRELRPHILLGQKSEHKKTTEVILTNSTENFRNGPHWKESWKILVNVHTVYASQLAQW